jgi:uncharacterized OB-fold protein
VAAARPAAPGLFELDGDTIRLVGGYSPTSGEYHFPLLATCPYSGAEDVERVLLSTEATLWLSTSVSVAPPGYRGEVPFGFGVVELTSERLRIVTRLAAADPELLEPSLPMRLVADPVFTDDDGTTVVTWAFAPRS